MSLIIDNGLILPSPTTSDRNTFDSTGSGLTISTSNGNIIFNSTQEFNASGNINLLDFNTNLGGKIHKTSGIRGRTNGAGLLNANTASNYVSVKTNNTTQFKINNVEAIYTNNPQMITPTSSTAGSQYLSMNNFMSYTTFTPTITTSGGVGNVNTTNSYGIYLRFGSIIYLTINIEVLSVGTLEPANQIRIGLPFTSASSQVQSLTTSRLNDLDMTTITSCLDIYGYIGASQNYFSVGFKQLATDDTPSFMVGSQIKANTALAFSGYYFI